MFLPTGKWIWLETSIEAGVGLYNSTFLYGTEPYGQVVVPRVRKSIVICSKPQSAIEISGE